MKNYFFKIHVLLRYLPYVILGILFITLSSFNGCRIVGEGDEEYYAAHLTQDNKLVMAGYTTSNYIVKPGGEQFLNNKGQADFFLSKRDTFGSYSSFNDIIWDKSYGGSRTDKAYGLDKTTDGGYILAGYTESNDGDVTGAHGSGDVWVVKVNSVGQIQWSRCYGGSRYDIAYAIRQTRDGGYIFVGSTNSNNGDVSNNHLINGSPTGDVWVVKINATGTIQWQKCLGGTGNDGGYDIQTMPNGGYILAGFTNSKDGDIGNNHTTQDGRTTTDAWIAVLDAAGNRLWSSCYGGTGYDVAMSIKPLSTSSSTAVNYVFVGYTSSSNNGDIQINRGNYDVFCMRLNQNGTGFNVGWRKTYGGEGNDYGKDIIQESSGTLIILANSASKTGDLIANSAPIALRVGHNNGDIISTSGNYGLVHSRGNQLLQYKANGILGVGGGDVRLGAGVEDPFYDPNLEAGIYKTELKAFNSAFQDEDEANALAFSEKKAIPKDVVDVLVYPNPSYGPITVASQTNNILQVQLFSTTGQMVWSADKLNTQTIQQDLSNLPKGIYLLKTKTDKGEKTAKVTLN